MASSYRIINEKDNDENDDSTEEENDDKENLTAFEKLNSGVSTVQAFFKCRKFVQITKNERTVQRLNSELLTAIENDDLTSFNNCLNSGASVNATCTEGGLGTCHVAVIFDRCDLLTALLDKGADDLAATWKNSYLPVHLAAWSGCLKCLKVLVERHPETLSEQTTSVTRDFRGNALILDSWAHECESTSCKVPTFVPGSTPLHIACKQLNVDSVQYLLSKQPQLEITDSRNMTALDVVNENIIDKKIEQFKGCEMFQKIMISQADLRYLDSREAYENLTNSALSLNTEESESCTKIVRIICKLIDAGARFSVSEENRKNCTTILHTAILTQNETLTKILLKKSFDVTVRNELGDTALHLALRKGAKKCLILLLSWDEDGKTLEIKDYANRTPLQIALTPGWSYGVCLLIEAGANVDVITDHGDNVLHLAASGKNPCVMDQLLANLDVNRYIDAKNDNDETPLMVAVLTGNLDGAKILIKHGAHLRITAKNNRTLAHAAAERGHLEILQLILNMDRALVDAKTDDGETALHLASLEGHLTCVQLLLRKGCDITGKTMKISINKRPNFCSGIPDSFDFSGMPLHCAVWKGRLNVATYLIEQDRKLINEPNINGWYPLHIAAYFNHVECTELIIKNGGNLYRKIPFFDGCVRSAINIITYTFADPMTFFHKIFNSFITMDDLPLNHPECLVTFNFEIFTPCGDDKKQMKVLNALLNTEQDDLQTSLLLHPLTETFLHLKWQKLSKFFVYITVLYTIFTVSLTSFALLVRTEQMENLQAVPVFVMLFTLVLLSFQEILHASKLQRYYINDLESWIKWSTFLTAFIVSIGGINSMFNESADTRWKNIIAIPVLLSWIEILFLLSRFPVWGFYVLMFFRVTSNVIKVFLTFASLILGFVFSFFILFKSSDQEFCSIGETFVKVIAMMSEFNYSETFKVPETMLENPSQAAIYILVSRLIFLLFVILIAIVLMNLMIGLAVSDITTLEAQGKSQRLAKHIDFLHLLETFVYSRTLLKWLPEKIGDRIKKNRKVSKTFSFYPGRPHGSELQKLPDELRKAILKYLLEKKNISGFAVPTNKDLPFYSEKKLDFSE